MVLIFWFCVLLASFMKAQGKPLRTIANDMEIIHDCNGTSPINFSDLNRALYNRSLPSTTNQQFKCFLLCLYVGYGLITENGNVIQENMLHIMKESTMSRMAAKRKLLACSRVHSRDPCEIAFLFTKCFWEESTYEKSNEDEEDLDYLKFSIEDFYS